MRSHALVLAISAVSLATVYAQQLPERAAPSSSSLPLAFEPVADGAGYVARGSGYVAHVGADGVRLGLRTGSEEPVLVGVSIVGADLAADVDAQGPLPGRSHYLIGNDPRSWRTDVPQYRQVRAHQVLPGVDVVYYGNQRQLEYDLVVAPGADTGDIALRFSGVSAIDVDERGDLRLRTAAGTLVQQAPFAYQDIDGQRRQVDARYVVCGGDTVGFVVDAYDRDRPLVIDPVLTYGSYLGGSTSDYIMAMARDAAGNLYFAGQTTSIDFPLLNPLQSQRIGLHDLFVTKVDPTGTQLLYSMYIGSDEAWGSDEWPLAIGVDGQGRAVVLARGETINFPTVNAAQPANAGGVDALVFMLDPTGSQLVYSTYLGGSGHELDSNNGSATGGLAVDAAGFATVASVTWSTNFPTKNPMQGASAGGSDGFVTRYDPTGQVVYSTYLGGSGFDRIYDAALAPTGELLACGQTNGGTFPTTAGAYRVSGGQGFLLKFDAINQRILRSTRFLVTLEGIAADPAGNVYVIANDNGSPTTPGAFQERLINLDQQGWIGKFDPGLTTLIYGTYYGFSGVDELEDIAVDATGHAYVIGSNLQSPTPDALAFKLNADASALIYDMRPGGQGSCWGMAVVVETEGAAWFAGSTRATSGVATAGALQGANAGTVDGFFSRIADPATRVAHVNVPLDRLRGNTTMTASVSLDGAAPSGGITVALASSDTTRASVPASVVIAAGSTTATFAIAAAKVFSSATVQITATFNGTATDSVRVWPGPLYRIEPIVTTYDAYDPTEGYGINAFGTMVGDAQSGIFRDSQARGLEILGQGDSSAINDQGQVTGGRGTAFRYTDGVGFESLGALQPNKFSIGYDINNAGQVVGQSDFTSGSGSFTARAFRWTEGVGMQNLGSLGDYSIAQGINNLGQVVGLTEAVGTVEQHAFRYTDGIGMVDLGVLSGHWISTAWAINDAGQVTGQSLVRSPSSGRAFLYDDAGGMVGLGLLPGDSFATGRGINSFGHVVGRSGARNDAAASRAVRWVGGGVEDLDEVLSGQDAWDWQLYEARDINDRGEIVGYGPYYPNVNRGSAFRLVPEFFAPYGRGCAGQNGRTAGLMGLGRALSGSAITLLVSGRAQSQAVLLAGLVPAQLPIGGCELLLGAPFDTLAILPLDAAGVARVSTTLPSSLPAVSLYLQALVLDPDAPNQLFTATNGVEMRIPY